MSHDILTSIITVIWEFLMTKTFLLSLWSPFLMILRNQKSDGSFDASFLDHQQEQHEKKHEAENRSKSDGKQSLQATKLIILGFEWIATTSIVTSFCVRILCEEDRGTSISKLSNYHEERTACDFNATLYHVSSGPWVSLINGEKIDQPSNTCACVDGSIFNISCG